MPLYIERRYPVLEPGGDFSREKRRKALIYGSIIAVEPFRFFLYYH